MIYTKYIQDFPLLRLNLEFCCPISIMIDHKQLENVESFKYLGSMLTNDGRCTCEIKSRIAMEKAAFNKKKTLFTSTLDLI